jgi:hypothetical protein
MFLHIFKANSMSDPALPLKPNYFILFAKKFASDFSNKSNLNKIIRVNKPEIQVIYAQLQYKRLKKITMN